MAAVSVFVDDAIRGRLPLVCAKTGEPADLVIRIRQPVGGGAPKWAGLLVLLGPPGWLIFFLISIMAPGPEYLTVRIPETDASYGREKQLQRFRTAAFVAALAVPLLGLTLPGDMPALWLALGGCFLVAAVALCVMLWWQNLGVHLDASRRWVTLTGVHPAFVEAVNRQEALSR